MKMERTASVDSEIFNTAMVIDESADLIPSSVASEETIGSDTLSSNSPPSCKPRKKLQDYLDQMASSQNEKENFWSALHWLEESLTGRIETEENNERLVENLHHIYDREPESFRSGLTTIVEQLTEEEAEKEQRTIPEIVVTEWSFRTIRSPRSPEESQQDHDESVEADLSRVASEHKEWVASYEEIYALRGKLQQQRKKCLTLVGALMEKSGTKSRPDLDETLAAFAELHSVAAMRTRGRKIRDQASPTVDSAPTRPVAELRTLFSPVRNVNEPGNVKNKTSNASDCWQTSHKSKFKNVRSPVAEYIAKGRKKINSPPSTPYLQ